MHLYAMNDSRPPAQILMACLGEESRFRLVQALIGGARCVTDLAAEVGLSQSCTTRHLQALERRRLVIGRRDGKRVLYQIRADDPRLQPLLGWALTDPGDEAATRSRRPATSLDVQGAAVVPAPGGAPVEPHSAPDAIRSGPSDRAPSATAPRPESARAQTPELDGRAPPAPEPQPSLRPARRSGSDIEDFLL